MYLFILKIALGLQNCNSLILKYGTVDKESPGHACGYCRDKFGPFDILEDI